LEVAARSTPVDAFFSTIRAPGTTAPLASLTPPVTDAEESWADADGFQIWLTSTMNERKSANLAQVGLLHEVLTIMTSTRKR
jgi:hypothetical protein